MVRHLSMACFGFLFVGLRMEEQQLNRRVSKRTANLSSVLELHARLFEPPVRILTVLAEIFHPY